MDSPMNERSWLVCIWIFCVVMGGLARFLLVSALDIWSADGRMTAPPWVFTTLDLLPIVVAGVLFLYITTDPYHKELQDVR